jgi:Na+:H+ antiporter, NhaA family
MGHQLSAGDLPRTLLAERAFTTLLRFLHVEAVSGVVLLIAAAAALIWANSPFAYSYHALWHLSFSIGLAEFVISRSLHFWIHEALMTVFFLIVVMEIRREIDEGALSKLDQAILPIGLLARIAKLGVLLGSLIAVMLGLGWGVEYVQRLRNETPAHRSTGRGGEPREMFGHCW